MSKYAALCNNLQTLDLVKIREMLDGVINKINSDTNYTLTDALLELTNAEIKFRDERARRVNIAISSFPYVKTIQDFDFSFQPDINKNKILDLVSLRFMETKSNIVFMDSPGVGKTHLATAIGVESASQRMSTKAFPIFRPIAKPLNEMPIGMFSQNSKSKKKYLHSHEEKNN